MTGHGADRGGVTHYVCAECPNIIGIPDDHPLLWVIECSECGFRATTEDWREIADVADEDEI